MRVLITGCAGFIGNELAIRLVQRGDTVIGIDNLNDYYEVSLKKSRLARISSDPGFQFYQVDIADRAAMESLFSTHQFDAVVNLAAQAGVRYSLENPHAYLETNLLGFGNVLEGCRRNGVEHLVFASSSSVYGANTHLPFSEQDNVDHPVSLYAATKKSNELMAHSYADLYGFPVTGLRFFTVYGPWGRPDMAYYSFTRKILAGEAIPVFNRGKMMRDFTYIDDVIDGLVRVIDHPATVDPDWNGDAPNPSTSYSKYRIYNIGNHTPVELMTFINILEKALGKEARMELLPMQAGDVRQTMADTSALNAAVGFEPHTNLETGLANFVEWYRVYHSNTPN